MEEAMLERLLEKGVTMVEYRCGIKNGEVTQIEHADFHNYRWSGCIEGDKAILEWKDYLGKKIGEEMSVKERREEALHKHMEKMLAEWYGREVKSEEEMSEDALREEAMYKCIERALAVWHAVGKK
jgi:hypothetical protein